MSVRESFPRITPFLWFDNKAEDAVNFYLTIFKNSRHLEVVHTNGNRPAPANVLTIAFDLNGQKFVALNGGPMFNLLRRSRSPFAAMQVMLKMTKLDIAELERAADS